MLLGMGDTTLDPRLFWPADHPWAGKRRECDTLATSEAHPLLQAASPGGICRREASIVDHNGHRRCPDCWVAVQQIQAEASK